MTNLEQFREGQDRRRQEQKEAQKEFAAALEQARMADLASAELLLRHKEDQGSKGWKTEIVPADSIPVEVGEVAQTPQDQDKELPTEHEKIEQINMMIARGSDPSNMVEELSRYIEGDETKDKAA